MVESSEDRKKELAAKYKIDFEKLEQEQLKLAKELELKDKIDFSLVERFGAIDSIFFGNKILSCIIVCDKNFEIIDRAYVLEKIKFPYVPGFRAYRELEAMVMAFEKLNERPDVVFVSAQGIIHPRLGLASHFSLSTGVPTIGISNSLVECEGGDKDGDDILKEGKKVGRVLVSKPGSNPMFISPGNLITIETSYKLAKDLVKLPHKRPEPMHLLGKYIKSVRKELG